MNEDIKAITQGVNINPLGPSKHSKHRVNTHLNTRLQYYFGINLNQYNALFYRQKGKCAGCQRHQSELKQRLHVDHDHRTSIIRGLLCGPCNRAIGLLQDNPFILLRLADYLGRAHLGKRIRAYPGRGITEKSI